MARKDFKQSLIYTLISMFLNAYLRLGCSQADQRESLLTILERETDRRWMGRKKCEFFSCVEKYHSLTHLRHLKDIHTFLSFLFLCFSFAFLMKRQIFFFGTCLEPEKDNHNLLFEKQILNELYSPYSTTFFPIIFT